MASRDPWWDRAACKDSDPEIFVVQSQRGGRTPKSGVRRPQDWSEARAICAQCPVQPACLKDALNNSMAGDGISAAFVTFAGGMTPAELTEQKWKLRRKGVLKL